MNDTNVNLASCIVTKNHFGYDTAVNICSGKSVDVAWAFGDWVGLIVIALMAAFFTLMLGGIIKMMLSDSW